jgi:predicted lipoprotein with Yx(FWY)xxD motif
MRMKSVIGGLAALAIGLTVALVPSVGGAASAGTPRPRATQATAGPRAAALETASLAHRTLTAGLKPIKVKKYGSVLADRGGFTLYLLTTEAGGKLHCKGQCLLYWPPLLVSKGQKVGVGKGVKGKVGTIARSSTTRQVTFNGYPVYTYVGDNAKAQTNGEGLVAFGGTWYMLRPASKKASTTPVK